MCVTRGLLLLMLPVLQVTHDKLSELLELLGGFPSSHALDLYNNSPKWRDSGVRSPREQKRLRKDGTSQCGLNSPVDHLVLELFVTAVDQRLAGWCIPEGLSLAQRKQIY